jgi:hypothetical protein
MKTKTETKPAPTYVGVDIGKAGLDVSFAGQSPCRYANSAAGIAELLKALKKLKQPQVVCEPSGGYERDLLGGVPTGSVRELLIRFSGDRRPFGLPEIGVQTGSNIDLKRADLSR